MHQRGNKTLFFFEEVKMKYITQSNGFS